MAFAHHTCNLVGEPTAFVCSLATFRLLGARNELRISNWQMGAIRTLIADANVVAHTRRHDRPQSFAAEGADTQQHSFLRTFSRVQSMFTSR